MRYGVHGYRQPCIHSCQLKALLQTGADVGHGCGMLENGRIEQGSPKRLIHLNILQPPNQHYPYLYAGFVGSAPFR